jgi:hypothetical protein
MKTRNTLLALLLLAALRTATLAETVSLSPQKDNTLYQDAAGQISNGQGVYLYAGLTQSSGLRRGLIAFDLSSIPANATITGATLSMFLFQSGPGFTTGSVSLNKVLRNWGEGASNAGEPGGAGVQAEPGDATWVHTFYSSVLWTTPGGDFSATASATAPITTANMTYSWSGSGLIADVQSWVSTPSTNFGWVILGNEMDPGTAHRFNSDENTSNPPQLTVTFEVPTLANISTRLRVETGDNVLIAGFIVTGTELKRIIVRAIGPSLPFAGVLANPTLELRNSSGALIFSNDNWRIGGQEAEIIATGIPPGNDLESAIVADLPANNAAYTAIMRGVNNGTGIGVVEVYDLDRTVDSKLGNISTRGLVGTGDNVLIGGMIVLGQNPLRVIVRALGPSLPVPGALGNPTLELRDGDGALVAFNDDWRDDPLQESEINATGIPPTNDLESAMVKNLAPGSYTAIVRGLDDTTGVAVVEAYGLN